MNLFLGAKIPLLLNQEINIYISKQKMYFFYSRSEVYHIPFVSIHLEKKVQESNKSAYTAATAWEEIRYAVNTHCTCTRCSYNNLIVHAWKYSFYSLFFLKVILFASFFSVLHLNKEQ